MRKWAKNIKNYSLNKKITCIILVTVFLTVSFSAAGISMTLSSSNELLYEALAGSLSYSAEDISKKLSTVESMTNMIVSNSNIRKNLITISDDTSYIRRKNAYSILESLLADYQQTYKNNNISYIALYTEGDTVSSYKPGSAQVAEEIHQEIIEDTNKNAGYPVWKTNYCNSYGLFLGRECRRVDQLSFDTLGTVVVCIDMKKLVSSSTKSILHSGEAQYVLYEEGQAFYHSPALKEEQVSETTSELEGDFGVVSLDQGEFFAVRGEIGNNGWTYLCLIPYDSIASTQNLTKIAAFALILLSVCISLFLSRLLIRSTTKDFIRLVEKMKAFAKDNLAVPEKKYNYQGRTDEIGLLHNQFDQMTVKIQDLIQKNYVNEILTKDARLKELENQINPHFLYNTLESVNWRAKAIGEVQISAMVEALGSLLRESLNAKEKTFTIGHELQIVSSYITIQRIRFEERLQYEEKIDPDILGTEVPQFTIQPLVENAIHYGMEEIIEPCHICVTGRKRENGCIVIEVKNNGSQFEENLLDKLEKEEVAPRGFGIGLLNIHKRIQIIYGPDYGLELVNEEESYAVARVIIPGGKHAETADRGR